MFSIPFGGFIAALTRWSAVVNVGNMILVINGLNRQHVHLLTKLVTSIISPEMIPLSPSFLETQPSW